VTDVEAAPQRPLTLSDRYRVEDGQIYLSGVQALVRLPLDQRRRDRRLGRDTAAFVSGYEGSPLAGYDLELLRQKALLDDHGVVFRPGLNEELAVNAVQGSQLASIVDDARHEGVAGYWYGKAPGLDRASDALRHANLGGASPAGGALAMVGDDVIAKSSTVPSSSEIALAELGLPVLVPADPQDILDLGIHGIEMSRFSGLWVGMKVATNVADGSASALVGPSRVEVRTPDNRIDGRPYVHAVSAHFLQPTLNKLEHSLVHERLELARRYAAANALNTSTARDGDTIGIVAAGSAYLDLRQALDMLGLPPEALADHGIRILKLGMVWPLVPEEIERFADGLDEILVVEEKRSFIESGIKDILYGRAGAPVVTGKRDVDGSQLLRPEGDLGVERIARAIATRLSARMEVPGVVAWLAAQQVPVPPRRRALTLVPRTPFFCSGCPHNRSTEVPEGSLVGAGIGCSAMAMLMPPSRVGNVVSLSQMGGEGAAWIGMSPFVETGHLFQNIGDGTFHHSGSLAVRAAVAAGSNITFKLLYNSAVAMTGGQQAVGNMSLPDLTRMLVAEGVRRVVVTTEDPRRYKRVRLAPGVEVRHRDRLISTQEELAAIPGVTVLIHDQECATELRRKRKRAKVAEPAVRAYINERVCEGCGDCGRKSNCVSVQPVETEFGRKTQIHQPSCNKDYSCLDGDCPSFLTVVPARDTRTRRTAERLESASLPEPQPTVDPARFAVRITGIGGTGVVTVAQILSTAATMAGRSVRALDQTGLAQKGGAVVSDLKVTAGASELSNKLSTGECDLYLGCDVLVAAAEENLSVADPARTVAVVSSSEVPTGAMVVDTTVRFPAAEDTLGRISDRTRSDAGRFVDARAVTRALFDDDQYANMFLVGVAYQLGAFPIPAERIEQAIALNGVATENNEQAFRRGRQLVCDPSAFLAAVDRGQGAPVVEVPSGEVDVEGLSLEDLLRRRVPELEAYQDEAYARSYADFVEEVRAAEQAVVPGASTVAEAVARYLYKFMAYKDEYEVARLWLDPALSADIEQRFGAGAKFSYRLHPPVLRALGLKKKVSLGQWFRPVFVGLYGLRRLRGTPVDPFGYTAVRRTERQLIGEYRELVRSLLADLTPENHAEIAEIVALPDIVRGYEEIKMANVAAYREALQDRLDRLAGDRQLEAAG
jgi:indolepyruvate ferredoxin oxidoreductase